MIVSPEFASIAWFWQRQNEASGVGEGQPSPAFPCCNRPRFPDRNMQLRWEFL